MPIPARSREEPRPGAPDENFRVTGNFPLDEWQRHSDVLIGDDHLGSIQALSWRLEEIRAALGHHPLPITSYLRADSTTQHGEGTAVDVGTKRTGLSQREIFNRLMIVEPRLRPYGQLIVYPFSDEHIHLSLATGTRLNDVRIADETETRYFKPTPDIVARIPGAVVASGVGIALIGGLALWALSRA